MLASALYADENQPLPSPGPAAGRPLVQVSLLAAAKLALRAALASPAYRRASWRGGSAATSRPCGAYRSHVDEVERALHALKRRVLIAGWSDAA